jgi:hypothetical protein
MTFDEADKIIAELNIVFPSKKLLVEEVKRWEENLVPFDYNIARNAVRKVEENMSRWPAWADFLREIKVCQQEYWASVPKAELEEAPPLPLEENLRRVRELQSLMKGMFRD